MTNRPGEPLASKPGPLTAAYVEVNNYGMTNVGKYALVSNGANVFDIGIVFAANINYDTTNKTAYLYFNPRTQYILDNAATQIAPLQAKGIRVLLSVLGNHQGAGFANFPNQQAAVAFARQLTSAVTTYRLDGVDFDDEYAEYGNNGTGPPNDWSFVYLVQALRNYLPDKIISMYFIGPSADRLSYGGIEVGSLLSYAWNPSYGSWSVPAIPRMTKAQLSPAAIEILATSPATAGGLAQRTIAEGYGAYLTYNLPDTDVSQYLSSFTRPLYGSDAVRVG